MADFEKAVKKVFEVEGGEVNDPTDKGGWTKFGISHAAYPSLDIKSLTKERAKEIYRKDFWEKIQGEKIQSQAVAEAFLLCAVNMGVTGATRLIQQLLLLSTDGIVGPVTINKLNQSNERMILDQLTLLQIERYVSICLRVKSQVKFLLGWIIRALRSGRRII